MLKLVLEGKPKPKPAGCIKYSHGKAYISMDVRGYNKWKDSHVKKIKHEINKSVTPYGIVYNVKVTNRQRLGDLTNITNAIQDILVQSDVLVDDSTRYVKKVFEVLTESTEIGYSVEVFLCESQNEFSLVVKRFL